MDPLIAFCGLVCYTCPVYLATMEKNKDQQTSMRSQIAHICNEKYGTTYKPEDITDCDGCRTERGRLFNASQDCKIRKCALQKELENCAHCTDYICDKLQAFFIAEPDAKFRLDEVRRAIHRIVTQTDL